MNPRHHLDEATLVGYSAGALPTAMAVVTAAHLGICKVCRERLRDADAIGGTLLQQQEPVAVAPAARDAMLAMLAKTPAESHHKSDLPISRDVDVLPAPLQPYFGRTFSALKWRMVAPGVHRIRAEQVQDSNLMLLRIGPGLSVPMHSHEGNELTMILCGSYEDALGHFSPGDVADLDSDITHQPVVSSGMPCICVAATDAPLRFEGWVARMLQPFFKM